MGKMATRALIGHKKVFQEETWIDKFKEDTNK
jgi:hypothetical protein